MTIWSSRTPLPRITLVWFQSLLAFPLLGLAAPVAADEVAVYAAASLTEALKEVAQGFEKSTGHKVVFNLGGSNDLARQIKAGAPADVFFSADKAQMDGLEAAGLVRAQDRVDVLSNVLVVVVPAASTARLSGPGDLPAVSRLALADPQAVPAGVYARTWLESIGLWDKLEDKVVPTLNVRAALAAVESENADAGIVYRTDAAISKRVKVAFEVPREPGARHRLSARSHRRLEEARHRRPRPLSHLACGSRGVWPLRVHRARREVTPADRRGSRRRPVHPEGRGPQHDPDPAPRRGGGARPGPLSGTRQGCPRNGALAAARPASHRGRPPPPRAALAPCAGRGVARGPGRRGGVHVEGRARRDGRHVLPAARSLGEDRLRGGRSPLRRHRPDARPRPSRRVLPRDAPAGLARE